MGEQPAGPCPRCGGTDLKASDVWSVGWRRIEVEWTCGCRLIFRELIDNPCPHDMGTYLDGATTKCDGCTAAVPRPEQDAT